MTQRALTQSMKHKLLPILIKLQNGFNCYQCKNYLHGDDYNFEHLNDNRFDNRIENLALVCHSCNIKKINDIDMKLKATELLKKNEERGIIPSEDNDGLEPKSNEIEINRTVRPFCKQYLEERVYTDGKISFNDALPELTYLSQEKFGCGAEGTIRKYLSDLTCKVAPFMIIKEGKERFIVKRTGN